SSLNIHLIGNDHYMSSLLYLIPEINEYNFILPKETDLWSNSNLYPYTVDDYGLISIKNKNNILIIGYDDCSLYIANSKDYRKLDGLCSYISNISSLEGHCVVDITEYYEENPENYTFNNISVEAYFLLFGGELKSNFYLLTYDSDNGIKCESLS